MTLGFCWLGVYFIASSSMLFSDSTPRTLGSKVCVVLCLVCFTTNQVVYPPIFQIITPELGNDNNIYHVSKLD